MVDSFHELLTCCSIKYQKLTCINVYVQISDLSIIKNHINNLLTFIFLFFLSSISHSLRHFSLSIIDTVILVTNNHHTPRWRVDSSPFKTIGLKTSSVDLVTSLFTNTSIQYSYVGLKDGTKCFEH